MLLLGGPPRLVSSNSPTVLLVTQLSQPPQGLCAEGAAPALHGCNCPGPLAWALDTQGDGPGS